VLPLLSGTGERLAEALRRPDLVPAG